MLSKPNLFKRGNDAHAGTPAATPTIAALNSNRPAASPASHHSPPESAVTTATAASESNSNASPTPEVLSGSRLIVGPDVKLKGAEIQDCDTLVVEGRVEATMDSRVIQIAADGAFSGKVGIDVAEIHGKFDGELTARSRLIIHATGRVSGKIRYGKILIEEGGELSGDVAAITSDSAKETFKPKNLHIAASNESAESAAS